jgi:hypothetical protein
MIRLWVYGRGVLSCYRRSKGYLSITRRVIERIETAERVEKEVGMDYHRIRG